MPYMPTCPKCGKLPGYWLISSTIRPPDQICERCERNAMPPPRVDPEDTTMLPPADKRCGTCEHMSEGTHKYDDAYPQKVHMTCERIPCMVFGEWHDRCSASALVTAEFYCALWSPQ